MLKVRINRHVSLSTFNTIKKYIRLGIKEKYALYGVYSNMGEIKMKITILLMSITSNFLHMNVVDCTNLKFDEKERAYLNTKENLYTGKCETFHKNGIKAIENNYKTDYYMVNHLFGIQLENCN